MNALPILVKTATLLFFFLAPASAISASNDKELDGCNTGRITDFAPIKRIISEFEEGNYYEVAKLMDLDHEWSEKDLKSVASQLGDTIDHSKIQSCSILQKKLYSDEFRTELILIQFESINLHIFVAAVLRKDGWEIIRMQFESDFNKAFDYLK